LYNFFSLKNEVSAMYEMNDFELMGDALDEVQEAFGKDYEVGPDLACPFCGTYGFCDCESSDLGNF
jgi:hypothetical protein